MRVIGLMSGTSLDGLDIALVDIDETHYQLLAAETVPYSDEWRQRLASLEGASAYEYALADVQLGRYFGRQVNAFLERYDAQAELIASHGHTIFHQPERGLTTQIGNADAIAAKTRLPVVANFRTLDVALGGQGAPLVPIGDRLLFGEYDACLNLGGIANISFERDNERIAFDICPCNMALNHLARKINLPYDEDGMWARFGSVDRALFDRLAALPYFAQDPPKSLGKEWFTEQFLPLIDGVYPYPFATVTALIVGAINVTIREFSIRSLLVTGGGARNGYLIECLRHCNPHCEIIVPDPQVVDYKEAIIFALLGYLRVQGKVNTLRSVTGAACDSIGGNVSGLIN